MRDNRVNAKMPFRQYSHVVITIIHSHRQANFRRVANRASSHGIPDFKLRWQGIVTKDNPCSCSSIHNLHHDSLTKRIGMVADTLATSKPGLVCSRGGKWYKKAWWRPQVCSVAEENARSYKISSACSCLSLHRVQFKCRFQYVPADTA